MSLKTKPNFPVTIDGMTADNNPMAVFTAFNQLQRPALHIAKGVVYAGWGTHCDEAPAHGWLFGVDMQTGAIVTHSATTWGPNGSRIWGGIWMGGTGFSTDREDR
ncbi:hypothetical protein HDU76_011945, partial [Blyttiomyces sp. JEL0837]